MFDGYPVYSRYRTLKAGVRGEDVFALQTALMGLGHSPGPLDGIFGRLTERAVRQAQGHSFITVDGLAGGQTQTALCRRIAGNTSTRHRLPDGLLFGQLAHESSHRLGNYSPQRANGSYDAGVAQRNTEHTPPRDGFTVPDSIDALGALLRKRFDLYAGLPTRRRWELAAGAWNAPAYANYIAREEGAEGVPARSTARPGPTARTTLERYIDSATALMGPV